MVGSRDYTGVYETEGGITVHVTDNPYLLEDGKSLQPPLLVFDAGGPVYMDTMGNAQAALAVAIGTIPRDRVGFSVIHNGDQVTHDGSPVMHMG